MAGYNRIIMVGNLTRDPELKQLASGQSVCRLGIASNRQFKNRQTGQQIQDVCFVDVDVWGAQAESCEKFLVKGRSVLVEGRLRLDTWQDQQGGNRSKHSITADRVVFLSSAAAGNEDQTGARYDNSAGSASGKVSFKTENTAEFAKIEKEIAKKKAEKKEASQKKDDSAKVAGGSPEFKDEAPFEDDLPF